MIWYSQQREREKEREDIYMNIFSKYCAITKTIKFDLLNEKLLWGWETLARIRNT